MFGRFFGDRFFCARYFPNGPSVVVEPPKPGGIRPRRVPQPRPVPQLVHALVDCDLPAPQCDVLGTIWLPVHGEVQSGVDLPAMACVVLGRAVPATIGGDVVSVLPVANAAVVGAVTGRPRVKAATQDEDEQILLEHYCAELVRRR
jgi:hypothetical protein